MEAFLYAWQEFYIMRAVVKVNPNNDNYVSKSRRIRCDVKCLKKLDGKRLV